MKKLALLLALALLCAGTALASEWQPGQPNEGAPEIDLTTSLGYMMFSPNSVIPAEHIGQRLYVYFPRTDVQAGEGSLRVLDAEGEILAVPMASDAVTLRPMNDDEKALFHWQDGVCFEVRLDTSLPFGVPCHVNLDARCVVTLEGDLGNPPITGPDEWPVQVTGDFGVGSLRYLRDGQPVATPAAGDTIQFDLTMGGDAAIASMYSPDASVQFEQGAYDQSGPVVGQVVGDAPTWSIVFLGADGARVGVVQIQ